VVMSRSPADPQRREMVEEEWEQAWFSSRW
jgi:hypothetical protein